MTRQEHVFDNQQASQAVHCPNPISLETVALIHDSLAQLLCSLRGSLPVASAEAGQREYESWLSSSH